METGHKVLIHSPATGLTDRETINNAFYDELGERWYLADDDPVALLRAEGELTRASS